jgi:hypothetical protein
MLYKVGHQADAQIFLAQA